MTVDEAAVLCRQYLEAAPSGSEVGFWDRDTAARDELMRALVEMPDELLGDLYRALWPDYQDPKVSPGAICLRADLHRLLRGQRQKLLAGRFGIRAGAVPGAPRSHRPRPRRRRKGEPEND